MAFRSRLRRALTRGCEDDSTKPKNKSKASKTDPNVYGPGEKMPPLKYRRPVAPEHKAHLESFNWSKAWRRKSFQSVYSPMGSRMPSRRNSFQSCGRRSFARSRKSFAKDDEDDDGSAVDSGIGASIAGDDKPELLREGSDEEGDVTNVGLSRHPTNDPATRRRSSSIGGRRRSHSLSSRPATADRIRRLSTNKSDTPFTQEELELALKRSNLEATKEESDRSGNATPGSPGGGMFKHPFNDNIVHVERLRERETMVV